MLAGHVGYGGAPGWSLAVLAGTGAAMLAASLWMLRAGVLDAPLLRRRAENTVATRGEPAVWLVAHLDTKSQPVPMIARAGGITASAVLWIVALALCAAQLAGAPVATWWPMVSGLGFLAGLPIVASVVGERSPGALDNASGVATVLRAADLLPRDARIGVLLTSAEELGLAGARAFARARAGSRAARVAINCDGVDDTGVIAGAYVGRRPERLAAALARALGRSGEQGGARRLVPGVLVDGVALADAGWETLTIMRGTYRSFLRVHRPADDLAHLDGTGAERAALVMAAMVEELT